MTQIVIVGESWGEAEEKSRTPFVGAAGYELTRMLGEAGIERADCYLTNVFNLRPAGNKIEAICGPKSEAIKEFPALIKGKYVPRSLIPELERLGDEILEHNPNLIIALGNTPSWAMLGRTGISKFRGTTFVSTHTASGYKVLPTYHPAAVLRQWELRPVTVFDLIKAKREAAYAELRRPKRSIWIDPTIEDIKRYRDEYILPAGRCAVDIETTGRHITFVGFAAGRDTAIVIPFVKRGRKDKSYWPTPALEREAWLLIRSVLEARNVAKTFQNGLYDIAFIWRSVGIRIYGATHDTMLLHHSLQPESLKGLGFLGSVYTDESSWKDMRKVETIKRDD